MAFNGTYALQQLHATEPGFKYGFGDSFRRWNPLRPTELVFGNKGGEDGSKQAEGR